MMTAAGNADGKRSEQVEGKDVSRTVECLRGRLLSERTASRNAKEEADQLENKLIELETRLKEETKSRNRAEKRLKSLMKKLESLEIFYVSDESEQSGFVDKNVISCASSVASTSTKEAEDKQVNSNPRQNVTVDDIQELQQVKNPLPKSSTVPAGDSKSENVSQFSVSSCQTCGSPADEEVVNSYSEIKAQEFETSESMEKISSPEICPTSKETSSTAIEPHFAKFRVNEPSQNYHELNIDNRSFECSIKEEILNGGNEEEEQDDYANNSLALVAVDLPKTNKKIDPVVLDATVKEALDALSHAKEKLQASRERRRNMIKVG